MANCYSASNYYDMLSDRETFSEIVDNATWKWMNKPDVRLRLDAILNDFGSMVEDTANDIKEDEFRQRVALTIVRGVRECNLVSWGSATSPEVVQEDARAKITCVLLKRFGI